MSLAGNALNGNFHSLLARAWRMILPMILPVFSKSTVTRDTLMVSVEIWHSGVSHTKLNVYPAASIAAWTCANVSPVKVSLSKWNR